MTKLLHATLATVRLPARWLFRLLALALLLAWLPAQAVDYAFNNLGNLPAGCSGSNGNYACGALALAAGDTISVITSPTTITVGGALTTGASSLINFGGLATNLTLVVSGTTDLGAGTKMNANLVGAGAVTTDTRSAVVGNITTIAGVVNIGDGATVKGDIKTDSAAINVGNNNSVVTGNITTTIAGVINIGYLSTVNGNLTTTSGAINVSYDSKINGSIISSLAGAITIGERTIVTGNVVTTYAGTVVGAGAITIETGSEVRGSVTTNTGAITVATLSKIGGSVTANTGATTVGAGATVGGSVCSGKAGAITIEADAKVAGNVETALAGAITVGARANVAGTATVKGAGALTIVDGAIVGTTANNQTCGCIGPNCTNGGTSPPLPLSIKSRAWRQIFVR